MTPDGNQMEILVTLDEAYIPYLNVMLSSLLHANPKQKFRVWLLHTSVRNAAMEETRRILDGRGQLVMVSARDIGIDNVPTSGRYPREMYYRIFAARYLPKTLDRVLYLDPDIVVIGNLSELYHLPLDGYYFAAASHVGRLLNSVNSARLDMARYSPYINSGVLLMNLELLRREQNFDQVFSYIDSHRHALLLPDQDVISSLYGEKILAIDPLRFNMTERLYAKALLSGKGLTIDWLRSHTIIIHYCGRNKPWKETYHGSLDVFWKEATARLEDKRKHNETMVGKN